jgi:outer membrane lipoprotein-sorting protein
MRFVPALMFVVGGASLLSAAPPKDDLFTQLFQRSVARQQTLKSIRARFTETTVSSLLEKPIVAHGTIIAAPPARVLMTYTDPERRIVTMDSKTMLIAFPDRSEQEKVDISSVQKRIDQYFTHANVDDLRSMFDVTAEHDPTMKDVDHVDMRPKRKQIKQGLERLELWIDTNELLLVQMQMTFPGGDRKTIRLEGMEVNVALSEDTFRIKP